MVGYSPHLLPIKLLGIKPHAVVEVRFVDIQVHHARIRSSDLCDVRVAEPAAHLCCAAPLFDLALHFGIVTLNTCNNGMPFAGTLKVGNHLAYGTAGI